MTVFKNVFGNVFGNVLVPITGAGGFLPNQLPGLRLWLDAADTATITESGGDVSQWGDKSGNGNNAVQAVSANQPKTGLNVINGLNAIAYDLGMKVLEVAGNSSIDAIWSGGGTVFFVSQSNSLGPADSGLLFDKSQGWRIEKSISENLDFIVFFTGDAAIFSTVGDSFPAPFNPSILTLKYDADNVANIPAFYLDGTLVPVQVDESPVGTHVTNSNPLGIGNRTTPPFDRSFDGDIGEIIIYDRIISDLERVQVESYLSNKWGIPLA